MDSTPSPPRDAFLAVFLSLLVAGGFSVFLMIITGGFFLYVLAIVAGIVALGYVNYLLWGRSMSRQVAESHEEEEARGEHDEWPYQEWQDPRRF